MATPVTTSEAMALSIGVLLGGLGMVLATALALP